MANKYHFNKETGRIGQCRATKKGCPLGGDTPHFDTKDEAQKYVEKESSKGKYSFSTINKKGIDDLALLENLPEVESYRYDYDDYDAVRKYLEEYAPSFHVKDSHMRVDYINEALIEKDGNLYIMRAHAGWSGFNITEVSRVEEAAKVQLKTRILESGNKIHDVELSETMDELYEINKEYNESNYKDKNYAELQKRGGFKMHKINFNDSDERIQSGKYSIYVSSKNYIHEREDGSKIIVEGIIPLADRELTDEPNQINVDIDFTENGELQNSRRMDKGMTVFDTRLNRGFVIKYKAGSEDADSGDFVVEDYGIRKLEENETYWSSAYSQEVYKIEGAGVTESSYYKKI